MKKIVCSVLAIVCWLVSACDSGNPVAPVTPVTPATGASLALTLSAAPTQVPAGSGMPSTVTVSALQEDGQPPADGTLATLSTDLGNFGAGDGGMPRTMVTVGLVAGNAQVSLFPAAEAGAATVLAQVGAATAMLQVEFFVPSPSTTFVVAVEPGRGGPAGGQSVTVRGGGFASPLRVAFGGAPAQVVSSSSTTIEVITPGAPQQVPPGQSLAVDVTVTAALDQAEPRMATLPGGFTYVSGSATFFVTEVNPNRGSSAGGQRVSVLGGGFRAPVRVEFGGVAGAMAQVVDSGTITVTVPSSASPVPPGDNLAVDVTVTNALNEAEPQSTTLVGGYTYVDSFFVTSVEPATGPPAGGQRVRVLGGGFVAPVRVEFGGVAGMAPEVDAGSQVVRVTVPAAPQTVPPGGTLAVDVTVTNAQGSPNQVTATVIGGYTYVESPTPPIIVTSMTPSEGSVAGGTEVTVTGRGFAGQVTVELAGVRQSDEIVDSATSLRFTTVGTSASMCPADGGLPQTGIVVTDVATGVQASADLTFTYQVPVPRIARVTPTFGPQLGNQTVNVEGSDFEDSVRVVFAKDGEEFAGVVQSVTDSALIRVTSPRVPDTLFPQVDCVIPPDLPGKRLIEVTVDILVTNRDTGCMDTFGNAYTYSPTDPVCRQVPPP